MKEFFRSNWVKPLVSYLATFKSRNGVCSVSETWGRRHAPCALTFLRWWPQGLESEVRPPALPAFPAAGTAWINWQVNFLINSQFILNKAVSCSCNASPSFFFFPVFHSPEANPGARKPLLCRAIKWCMVRRTLAHPGPRQWGLSGARAARVVSCVERKHCCYVLQNWGVGVTHVVWSWSVGAAWSVGPCFWWGSWRGEAACGVRARGCLVSPGHLFAGRALLCEVGAACRKQIHRPGSDLDSSFVTVGTLVTGVGLFSVHSGCKLLNVLCCPRCLQLPFPHWKCIHDSVDGSGSAAASGCSQGLFDAWSFGLSFWPLMVLITLWVSFLSSFPGCFCFCSGSRVPLLLFADRYRILTSKRSCCLCLGIRSRRDTEWKHRLKVTSGNRIGIYMPNTTIAVVNYKVHFNPQDS